MFLQNNDKISLEDTSLPKYLFTQTLNWNADMENSKKLKSFKFNEDSTFTITINLPRNSGCTEITNTGRWKIISRYNKETEKNYTSGLWQEAIKENTGDYRYDNEDSKAYLVMLEFEDQGEEEYYTYLEDIMNNDSLFSNDVWNIKNGWAFDCYRGLNRYRRPTISKASQKYPLLLKLQKKSETNNTEEDVYNVTAYLYFTYWGATGESVGVTEVRKWTPSFWTVSNLD